MSDEGYTETIMIGVEYEEKNDLNINYFSEKDLQTKFKDYIKKIS